MRWKTWEERHFNYRRWFAWHPVRLDDPDEWVWLEWVWRRGYPSHFFSRSWDYRSKLEDED